MVSLSTSRRLASATLVAVLFALHPTTARPGLDKTGRWTGVTDWAQGNPQKYAIHLVLLRGDGNPYDARILWWRGEGPTQFSGGLWGWTAPEGDTCQAWPEASFDSIGVDPSGVNFFCGGHAGTEAGDVVLVSGTSPSAGTYGENRVRLFSPGTGENKGSWTEIDSLEQWRWYSTATTLAHEGRILVTSGSQHRFHRVFGGRRHGVMPADNEGDELHRFSGVVGGDWETEITPSDDEEEGDPDVRENHTFVDVAGFTQVLFGGRDRDGDPLNDAWNLIRGNNDLGADYSYFWDQISVFTGDAPSRRSDHSAVAAPGAQMLVFGGLDNDSLALNDTHRLFPTGGTPEYAWEEMQVTGAPPPVRFGHQAVYQETPLWSGGTAKRMFVFGGRHPDSTATDDRLWQFTIDPTDPNEGTWEAVTTTDLGSAPRRPLARAGHAMVRDSKERNHPTLDSLGHVSFLYGGKLPTGSYSDTLWALWTFRDGTIRWEVVRDTVLGTSQRPGTRAEHSLTYDGNQGPAPTQQPGGRLYLFGGLASDAALADSGVFVLDPWVADNARAWQRWEAPTSTSFTGHTMTLEFAGVNARVAEVYDVGDDQWTTHSSATLYDRNYPITFAVASPDSSKSRVVTVPASTKPYYLDIPRTGSAGAWQPSGARKFDWVPLNGVLYQPDRMMIGGGAFRTGDTLIVDSTFTFDVSNPGSSNWEAAGLRQHTRYFHNLVILPTGEVLAVGGTEGTSEEAVATPVLQPEVWDPETLDWSDAPFGEELASQAMVRDYHSSAILLLDGRVLSAGGQNKQPDRGTAELFCPPYLFGPDGLAAERPAITGTPFEVTWNQPFTVCAADVDSVTRAVLIRPGMTTHSFDQNQRYVPLSRVTKASNPARLLVTMPAEAGHAPPGDYMLFLTGSADGGDVPSMAKWVRVSSTNGTDACDEVAPGPFTSLWPELISQTAMYLSWRNTADDDSIGASGKVKTFDLRRSLQHINDEAGWSAASALSGEPAPDTVGVEHLHYVDNLQSCTEYYFGLRATDDASNLSGLHQQVKAKTLCSGGGGGDPNSAAGEVVNAETGEIVYTTRDESRRSGLSTQSGGGSSSAAALVVETESLGDGSWQFTLQAPAEFEDADASKMLRQVKDAVGDWQTQSDLDLEGAGARLGLAAMGRAGRKVFPGAWSLMEIAPMLRTPAGDLALVSAEHSSLGNLAQSTWSGDGGASLASGETFTLVYEPSESETSATQNWFALLQLEEGSSSPARDLALGEGVDVPKTFALYQNQPNPFSHSTSIRFDLPKPTSVRLTIYDIAGRKVRTLTSSDWPAGRHALEWDHRSDAGVQLGAGAYIYRLVTNEFQSDKKMILLAR